MPLIVLIANALIRILMLMLLISSVLSWFQPYPRHPLHRLLNSVVDPLLNPIRALVPAGMGMDFSPMIAMLLLYLLQSLLQRGLTL